MTNKNIYPNKYTEQQTTQSVGFKGLSNLKYINSSYAQSSEVIKGKKHTPNKPARLILSNFKAQIPTGSVIQSLTVHYRHQTIPKNQGKYPNFSAPQIHLQGVKNTAIKGTAPTKDAKINKVTFKLSPTTTQINSTDFAVVFDYPANSNENEGYLRLYYVYITVTYKTSAFKLGLGKVNGGYNKEECTIQAYIGNDNPTGYNPNVTITTPAGFTFKKNKGNGTLTKINNHTFLWKPRMTKTIRSNRMNLTFDVNVSYPSNQDYYEGVFRSVESLTSHNTSKTVRITDRPVSKEDYIEGDSYDDSDTDTHGTEDTDIDKVNPDDVDYTVPVDLNGEHITLEWLPEEFQKQIIPEEIQDEDITKFKCRFHIKSDKPVNFKIGAPNNQGEIDPNTILATGTVQNEYTSNWLDLMRDYTFDRDTTLIEIRSLSTNLAGITYSAELDLMYNGSEGVESIRRTGFAGGGLFNFVLTEEQLQSLYNNNFPYYTVFELSREELDRLGDGENYTVQSYVQIPSEDYLVNLNKNFRIAVFNNPIESNIIRYKTNDDDNTEPVIIDTTDYNGLTDKEMLINAEYWGNTPTTPNNWENITCEFTHNKKYPLRIFLVGDFDHQNEKTINYTQPAIIETDKYTQYEPPGTYPIHIKDITDTDTAAELTIPRQEQASTIILNKLPLETGYGNDTDTVIRGLAIEFTIEKSDELIAYATLKAPTGKTGNRSIIINETELNSDKTVTIGGIGDLWNFNTEDLTNLEDWEAELTLNNTITDTTSSINYHNLKIIIYTETVDAQKIRCTVNGEDLSYYGIFVENIKIPAGLNTEVNYLQVNGTDINDPSVQSIREKKITIEFSVDSCDINTSSDMLRQVTQLLMNRRDEYNKPIPNTIEFSHYPDLYWEYILEDVFDTELEISDYNVKADLIIPAGTAYKKEDTVTGTVGTVQGLTSVKPVIIVKTGAEDVIEIRETISGQTFSMGFTGEWNEHLIEIDCDNRIVWMKENEDDNDPINISNYVDINSDWFKLLGEYNFETVNCILYTVTYTERW